MVRDGDLLNVFALVVYIPAPLGRFLDDLRRDLAPDCNPRAHVSVLPPRPLFVADWHIAAEQARSVAESWAPFEIEALDLRMFPVTDVVYLEIGAGSRELRELHDALNCRALDFEEPFDYYPHITVAQDLPPESAKEAVRVARARWSQYTGPRRFRAEAAVFVRNTRTGFWIDLATFAIGGVPIRSAR